MLKTLIEKYFGSRKLAAVIAGGLVNVIVIGLQNGGVVLPDEVVMQLTMWINGLIAAYLVGQGIADIGKEKAVLDHKTEQLKFEATKLEMDVELKKLESETVA